MYVKWEEVTLNNIVSTQEELVQQLEGLDNFRCIGPEGLHPRVSKETREQVVEFPGICILLEISSTQSCFQYLVIIVA